ncbi:MAG: hypothetical protein COB61_000055 [Thiotrichales bacterium]|nr:hypothetical protein [Thiotrichales bacterium]
MKKLLFVLFVSVCLSVLGCSQSDSKAAAESVAVTDISYASALKATAKIIRGLNHHPSSGEKLALATYIKAMDSSVNGAVLAETMTIVKAIEHFPSDSDKAKLATLIADLQANSGDADLIVLMEVVGKVAHKVSGGDAAKLDAIIAKY